MVSRVEPPPRTLEELQECVPRNMGQPPYAGSTIQLLPRRSFAPARTTQSRSFWGRLHRRPSSAGSLNGRCAKRPTMLIDRCLLKILGAGCQEKNWQNLQSFAADRTNDNMVNHLENGRRSTKGGYALARSKRYLEDSIKCGPGDDVRIEIILEWRKRRRVQSAVAAVSQSNRELFFLRSKYSDVAH